MSGQPNEPPKRKRDYTGAMIGAALRSARRKGANRPEVPAEKPGAIFATAVLVAIVVIGMLVIMLRFSH